MSVKIAGIKILKNHTSNQSGERLGDPGVDCVPYISDPFGPSFPVRRMLQPDSAFLRHARYPVVARWLRRVGAVDGGLALSGLQRIGSHL